MKSVTRYVVLASIFWLASAMMSVRASAAATQLPSCMVTADYGRAIRGQDVAYVGVDSLGNFYDVWTSRESRRTKLDELGVQSWKQIADSLSSNLEYRIGVSFYTTTEIEDKVCKRGRKVAFYEPLYDSAVREQVMIGIEPKPFTLVRELAIPLQGAYFLSSIGAESDAILNGSAGSGLATSSNGFRLPRVADDLVIVHRFFGHPNGGMANGVQESVFDRSHFYSADPAEVEELQRSISRGAPYVYEGPAFLAPRAIKVFPSNVVSRQYRCNDARFVPVFRMLNRVFNMAYNYRYVMDPKVVAYMTNRGWINDGASFCALAD